MKLNRICRHISDMIISAITGGCDRYGDTIYKDTVKKIITSKLRIVYAIILIILYTILTFIITTISICAAFSLSVITILTIIGSPYLIIKLIVDICSLDGLSMLSIYTLSIIIIICIYSILYIIKQHKHENNSQEN